MLAWEKMLAKTQAANWLAYAKMILYAGAAIALIIFVINYFKKGDVQGAQSALQAANATINSVVGG